MALITKKISIGKCLWCLAVLGLANFAHAGELVTKLKYVRDIETADQKVEGVAAVALDRPIFAQIDNFSDLRIIGLGNKEIPFRVRKQHARKEQVNRILCSSKVISLKKLDDNRIELVVQNLDKKHTPTLLTIRTPNRNYDKNVSLSSGTSAGEWGPDDAEHAIFDYSAIIELANNTVPLPKNQPGPFYKIVIANFSELKQSKRMEIIEERRGGTDFGEIKKQMRLNDDFKIDQIILEAEEIAYLDKAAVTQKIDTEILSQQDLEKDKQTVLILDVDRQPVVSVNIETTSSNFSRNISVYGSADKDKWNFLTSGKISRLDIGNYQKSELKIEIPERRYRYLKIEIKNGDTPPLKITEINCFGAVYHAEFLLTENAKDPKLYYGGKLTTPQYDIEEVLAKLVNPKYTDLKLAVEMKNPSYSAKSEEDSFLQSKALMYIIISVMVLVLGFALFSGMKKIDNVEKE